MPIVLSAPVAGPSLPTSPAAQLPQAMTWTGYDGSVWPLTRPAAVNPRMQPGVKGLHMPRFDVFTSATPLTHGEDVLGYWIAPRDVYWPLLFRARSVQEWESSFSAFFDSFHPVQTGVWTVGEGKTARSLPLRGAFRGDYAFERDPFVYGRAMIGVELQAPRPLWRGQPVRRLFKPITGEPFFPEGGAPAFHISPSNGFSTASIQNPGVEPSYLTYIVDGPQHDIELGVGDAIIQVPFPVLAGKRLVIATDPTAPFATLGDIPASGEPFTGTDVGPQLGFQLFAPVPPRGVTPITVQGLGAGPIAVELTPLYWTAL